MAIYARGVFDRLQIRIGQVPSYRVPMCNAVSCHIDSVSCLFVSVIGDGKRDLPIFWIDDDVDYRSCSRNLGRTPICRRERPCPCMADKDSITTSCVKHVGLCPGCISSTIGQSGKWHEGSQRSNQPSSCIPAIGAFPQPIPANKYSVWRDGVEDVIGNKRHADIICGSGNPIWPLCFYLHHRLSGACLVQEEHG